MDEVVVVFPCKYSTTGCKVSVSEEEKEEHEYNCDFRPFLCPVSDGVCAWQGLIMAAMPHIRACHKSTIVMPGKEVVFLATDIDIPIPVNWVMVQLCFGHHFMLVLEKKIINDGGLQQFFAMVQLVGSRKQAEKFVYCLKLERQGRRFILEASPSSVHEGVESAILNSDCLAFDSSIAQRFADNGNLGIHVTISKV